MNQLLSSCSPAAPLIHVEMEGRQREHGRLRTWRQALPSPTPDPAQAHKNFCPHFLARSTFCFSQLLGFLKPFTMDNTVSLSYFNKFVITAHHLGVAQWTNAFLNFSWKRGYGASPVTRTSSWDEIRDKSRIGPINTKFHWNKGRTLSPPEEGQLWGWHQQRAAVDAFGVSRARAIWIKEFKAHSNVYPVSVHMVSQCW